MESRHGIELVQGAIYEFHKPDPGQRILVEIVFMHGLQVKVADLKNAYYKTWRTADGNEVWPETWLKDKYLNARVLSLAYDSSAQQTGRAGNMGPYLLGESLLNQMVSLAGNIGQNNCPVVFVGHSLGGLIAKEIVVRCNSDRANAKYQNLLHNLKAVFFYATPHGGSYWADSWFSKIVDYFPFVEKSSLVKYLKPKETDRTHIHHDFLQAVNKDCKFYVVAEGQETEFINGLRKWIVHENSARFPGRHEFVMLPYADHKTVCKPQNKNDTGYLKLIDCINHVLEEYKRKTTIDLSVNPIGIQGIIDGISKLLESSEVSLVELFGMGGIGKTTLSKAFYNLNALKYVKSCYLDNVKSKAIKDVQKELLRGLCDEKLNQNECVERKHLDMIQDCFLKEKVLVVIDDVNSIECLENLQVFHALETRNQSNQSKVVVTSRDKAILPKKYLNSNKVFIEEVIGIKDPSGSDLELFLRYAFDAIEEDAKETANSELLDEAKKIVKLCNGLPLSLEVLGKYLGNSKDEDKDLQQWKEIWIDAYKRLQKAQDIDGNEIWSSLRISYDHLDDVEKKMFLDFACIFSKSKFISKSKIEAMWDSPIGVKNLVNKALLKEQDGRFIMHDQLRDMGQHILLKEALKDYQRPIYLVEGLEDLFGSIAELKNLTTDSGVPYIASFGQGVEKSLCYYSKLRLLNVSECNTSVSMDDCLSQCSGDLRWLRLQVCPSVTKLGIQRLCSFGGLRLLHIWECDSIVELPEDIGKLVHLVEMEVWYCPSLQSLPDTIGELKNLKRLIIGVCPNLQNLPDTIGELKNLKRLIIHACLNLQNLPDTIGELKNLKTLGIHYCQRLHVVPDSVGELCNLELLSFAGCSDLKVIHGTQICTQKLRELYLPIVPATCLRPCLQLQKLEIENGQGVKEFPQNFFKIDMPKLDSVIFLNHDPSVSVELENPDGSKLLLKAQKRAVWELEVHRQHDGSISQFTLKRKS